MIRPDKIFLDSIIVLDSYLLNKLIMALRRHSLFSSQIIFKSRIPRAAGPHGSPRVLTGPHGSTRIVNFRANPL